MNNLFRPAIPEGFEQLGDIVVPTGAIMLVTHDALSKKIKEVQYYKNMFVTAGKNSLADALRGTTENNKGIITYHANGTSIVAPALSDTDLGTELFRKLISVRSVANNVATFQTFFTTSESNGTIREMGLFGDDASSIPGSGTLFCHASVNRTKSSSDTLTASWAVTIG